MSAIFGSVSTDDQYMCDVFVIMPFKEEFRSIYENVVKELCEELKLSVKLGDDFFSSQHIIDEIWSAINNCSLVIADCTERNPNVFYELGIAHSLGKNTIPITKREEDIPFDIRGRRYIVYSDTVAGGKELERKLREAITKILDLKPSLVASIQILDSVHQLKKQDPKRFELSQSRDPRILQTESDKARQSDEYDWMELFSEAWTKIEPGSPRAFEDLGTALIRSRQPDKAIPIGENLVKLDRLNYQGYQILGKAYSLLGNLEEAKRWQELALRYVTYRFRQFVLGDLFKTYTSLGMVDEAIEVLEDLIPRLDADRRPYYEDHMAHLKQIKGG